MRPDFVAAAEIENVDEALDRGAGFGDDQGAVVRVRRVERGERMILIVRVLRELLALLLGESGNLKTLRTAAGFRNEDTVHERELDERTPRHVQVRRPRLTDGSRLSCTLPLDLRDRGDVRVLPLLLPRSGPAELLEPLRSLLANRQGEECGGHRAATASCSIHS